MRNGQSLIPGRRQKGKNRITPSSAILSIKERADLLLLGVALAAAFLCAQGSGPARAAERVYNPFAYIDGATITLTGTVAAVNGPEFTLDYEGGSITVEMDEAPGIPYEAEDVLVPGETVTVSGIIDDDIFERRTIEAGGIYIHEREVHYLTNMLDDPDAKVYLPPARAQKQSTVMYRPLSPFPGPIATKPAINPTVMTAPPLRRSQGPASHYNK